MFVADCVGVVASALKGEFAPAWRLLYPQVLKFCKSSRPDLDVSMGIGVIAEVSEYGVGCAAWLHPTLCLRAVPCCASLWSLPKVLPSPSTKCVFMCVWLCMHVCVFVNVCMCVHVNVCVRNGNLCRWQVGLVPRLLHS